MQLVQDGRLSLDGTIYSYLPDFAGGNGGKITVRQLLQHVSGLPNPDDTMADKNGVPAFYGETGPSVSNASRALAFCAGMTKAEPGVGFEYNNCDYLVLGAILERATGKSYEELLAARILTPLGLASVHSATDDTVSSAVGYTGEGKRYPPVNVRTFGAAGALLGTASDLIRFDRALLDTRLLSSESRAMLWQGNPKLGYEALGVWSFPARLAGCPEPVVLIERRGDVGGIQVRNVIAPALGRAVVVFTNDDTLDFGEVWQGKGLSHDLLAAAFCATDQP